MSNHSESLTVGLVIPLQGPAGMFAPSCEAAADLAAGEAVSLRFKDAARDAVVDGAASERSPPAPRPPRARVAPAASAAAQGDLF